MCTNFLDCATMIHHAEDFIKKPAGIQTDIRYRSAADYYGGGV